MHMIKCPLANILLALFMVLGSYKGYVALFDPGAEEPRQIYPYQVASLPPADQQSLKDGIRVRDDAALQQLLEDFLS